jgi:hypothetical protein
VRVQRDAQRSVQRLEVEQVQVLHEKLGDVLAPADQRRDVRAHPLHALIARRAPEQQPLGLERLELLERAPGELAPRLGLIAASVLHATAVGGAAEHHIVHTYVSQDVVEGLDDMHRAQHVAPEPHHELLRLRVGRQGGQPRPLGPIAQQIAQHGDLGEVVRVVEALPRLGGHPLF